MSVAYKIVPKKTHADDEPSWHGVVVNQGIVDKRALAHRIAQRSVLGAPEVVAVLEALIEMIPEIMHEGKILKLEGLGTFQLYAKSEGAASREAFKKEQMKAPRLHFQPSKHLKSALQLIEWKLKD